MDEEAHGYSWLAGVLQQRPGERASMVWDDAAHEAARDSEMMRDTIRAGAFRTHDDVPSLADCPRPAEADRRRLAHRQRRADAS